MSRLWTVTAHEFRMVAATRMFLLLTLLGPFLIVGMTVVPAVVSQRPASRPLRLAAAGAPPALAGQLAPALEAAGIRLEAGPEDPGRPRGELDARLLGGELDGYLVFPPQALSAGKVELLTLEMPDARVVETLRGVIGQAFLVLRLQAAGLEPGAARELAAPLAIETIRLTPAGQMQEQRDLFSFILVGIAFTVMLYMTILLYGQAIGRSVVQEKVSRTVEIVLSSVGERDLLFGKILGQAAAGLLQYAVWVGMAQLGVRLLGPALRLARLPELGLPVLLFLVLFFLLGFLLYSALFAALGAAAEDEQNLGQLSWPVILLLMFPMVASGPLITRPASSFSVFLSLFPPTAPMVMFVRILVSSPPAWQVALAVGLLVLAVAGVMILSARIFRVGILLTGRRFRLSEILRWLRA